MRIVVDVHDARTDLSRLLDQARAGQEIFLAKDGKLCARLMPLTAEPVRRQPGLLRGQIDTTAFFDPLPTDELDAWAPLNASAVRHPPTA